MERDSESERNKQRGTERKHLQRPGERKAKNQKEENTENETGRQTQIDSQSETHRGKGKQRSIETETGREETFGETDFGVRERDSPRPGRGVVHRGSDRHSWRHSEEKREIKREILGDEERSPDPESQRES